MCSTHSFWNRKYIYAQNQLDRVGQNTAMHALWFLLSLSRLSQCWIGHFLFECTGYLEPRGQKRQQTLHQHSASASKPVCFTAPPTLHVCPTALVHSNYSSAGKNIQRNLVLYVKYITGQELRVLVGRQEHSLIVRQHGWESGRLACFPTTTHNSSHKAHCVITRLPFEPVRSAAREYWHRTALQHRQSRMTTIQHNSISLPGRCFPWAKSGDN